MFKKSKKGKNTYGIVGLGRFGFALAVELAQSGADLLVLDQDEDKVRQMREYTEYAYVVKSLDRKSLEDTGIQNCDAAVVCISEEMDTSILTTLHLVSLGIPSVIAKAASSEHGEILEKLGAEVVYPERDMAIRLAHRLETSRMLDFIQLSEQLNISKLAIPDKIIGESVQSLNLRKKYGLNIIAIENGGSLIEAVRPDYVFQRGDILFLSGSKDGLNRLSEWSERT
ncbi:MAG: potassium channel family protein [Eubacteriales bacterium]